MNVKMLLVCAASALLLGTTTAFAKAPTFINIATASTSGSYYPAGIAMAKIWESTIADVKVSVQTSGGSVNNVQLMGDKEADIAFMDGTAYTALHGEGRYEGKPQPFIRAMVPLFPEAAQIVIAKDSGITCLDDLRGKRVSIGAVSSGTELIATQLLNTADIDPLKDISPERLSIADTAKAFMDKRIDAAIFVGSLGVPGMVEITTLDLVSFIDVPTDIMNIVLQSIPAWKPFTMPANTYKGQEKPIQCYASWNMLTVHEDMDEELIYTMTKALYADKESLVLAVPHMKSMDPQNLNALSVPLHEGAKRYYQEIGAME